MLFGFLLVIIFLTVRFVYPNWIKPPVREYLGKQDAQERQELENQYQRTLADALESQNASLCETLPAQRYQYLRKEDGAVHYSEQDRADFETTFPQNQCIVAYAVHTLDHSVCAPLGSRNHCYLEVANAMKLVSDQRFVSVCAEITQAGVQARCLDGMSASDQTDDLSTLNWGP